MGSLEEIKNSISDLTISNLSKYLGENGNGTRLALNLSLSTFLGAVIRFVTDESSAGNLIKILNDGGHTGNIFNNIETFSGNSDKAKLLEAIGNNIVNHFLKDNKTEIIDTLSTLSGIKSSSAYSLLNISAPVILGFIGKRVKERNLTPAELKVFLDNERLNNLDALPLSIQKILNIEETEKTSSSSDSKKYGEVISELNKPKNSVMGNIWPWVVLLLLGFSVYLFNENSKKKKEKKAEATEVTVIQPGELPKDSTSSRGDNVITDDGIDSIDSEKKLNSEDNEVPGAKENEGNLRTESANEQSDIVDTQLQQGPPAPPEERNNTPSGFSELGNNAFKGQSAEVNDEGALTDLFKSLEGTTKKVTIIPMQSAGRLGDDRAWGIRDFLIQKGIAPSLIIIGKPSPGNNPNGVAFKIEE